MRTLALLALAACAAAPLAGCGDGTDLEPARDPDKKAAAGGAFPAGWMGRVDRASQQLSDVKFVAMGEGFHVTAGPHAIYWNPANTATGDYTVRATFSQTKASEHPEGYGLILGGRDLDQPTQDYLYFLVRQDGQHLIKHRAGNDVHTLQDWTAHPAVQAIDATGKATNDLQVAAGRDSVRFLVNGTQVAALSRASGLNTDGIYGLRVNHNLDVQVDDFGVTKR
jgi:hypothetical protein